MDTWTSAEIGLTAIAFVFALIGNKLSLPYLSYGGVALLGVATIAMGMEAIVKEELVLTSRTSSRTSETFQAWAAYAQGAQFILMGGLLIGTAVLSLFNAGRALFLYLVRHPGLPLLAFGAWCWMAALIAIAGSAGQRQVPKWEHILELITSRWLPGSILIVIGAVAIGLGLFEIVAPHVFDQLGGGFLEILFGAQP